MQRSNKKRNSKKGQVDIEFTDKILTAWGGTASLISRFINKINFRIFIEKNFPVIEKSNNSTGIYSKIMATFITILNGGNRFTHANLLKQDSEVLERCFGIDRLPKSSTSITRFWNKLGTVA